MKVTVLRYVGLLIALSGCTGMIVNNEPSPKEEHACKQAEKNHYIAKNYCFSEGEGNQRTKRMMAWIELSKD